jgi:hypothetical protein
MVFGRALVNGFGGGGGREKKLPTQSKLILKCWISSYTFGDFLLDVIASNGSSTNKRRYSLKSQ